MKTCPACHQAYPDDVDTCPRDGAQLSGEIRDERECPHCAELILKKARLCKHCGREVEPLTGGDAPVQIPAPTPAQGTPEMRSPQPQTPKPAGAAGDPPAASKTPWLREKPEPPGRMKYLTAGFRSGRFRPVLLTLISLVTVFSIYLAVTWFRHGRSPLIPVCEDFKWGYIDKTGKYVIKPQFDLVGFFAEGLAAAWSGHKCGYIDRTGSYVIKPQFDYGWAFSEELARVYVGGKYEFIDRTGRVVFSPRQFDDAGDFYQGLAEVKVGGKWGCIDKTGKYAIEPQFDVAEGFVGGLASAQSGGKFGYIGLDGRFVIPPQFDGALEFSDNGLAPVKVGEKWGYINKTGTFVTAPQFTSALPFGDGFARVLVGDRWGYVDSSAKLVLKPEYEACLAFWEGLAPVKKDGRWGYIDKRGRFVIEPQFTDAGRFLSGMAYVDYRTSVISPSGARIWSVNPTSFEGKFLKQVLPLMHPYYEHLSGENSVEGQWSTCWGGELHTKNSVCFLISSGKPEEYAAAIFRDSVIGAKVASLGFDALLFEKPEKEAHIAHVLFGMKPTANGWEPSPSTALPSFLETADYYYQEGVKLQSSGDLPSAKTWFEAVISKFPKSDLVASAQQRLAAVNEAIAKAEAEREAEIQRQREERERLADEPTAAELDCVCQDIRRSGVQCDDPHQAYAVARVAKHAARMSGLPLCSER